MARLFGVTDEENALVTQTNTSFCGCLAQTHGIFPRYFSIFSVISPTDGQRHYDYESPALRTLTSPSFRGTSL